MLRLRIAPDIGNARIELDVQIEMLAEIVQIFDIRIGEREDILRIRLVLKRKREIVRQERMPIETQVIIRLGEPIEPLIK